MMCLCRSCMLQNYAWAMEVCEKGREGRGRGGRAGTAGTALKGDVPQGRGGTGTWAKSAHTEQGNSTGKTA